jgi:hypothetical protein
MKTAVAKSSFNTDNPERRMGEENLFRTCGYHTNVAVTVRRHTKRDTYVATYPS